MTTTPRVNTHINNPLGLPSATIHSAQRVGQSNNNHPTGFSIRIKAK